MAEARLSAHLFRHAPRSPAQARAFFLKTRTFSSSSTRSGVSFDSSQLQSAQSYCSNLVRQYDSPSYTLQYWIRPHILPAYLAIRAFNIEVARIPDLVSSPAIGAIRMQFWRDTINATFDSQPPAEPVAILLSTFLSAGYKLNKTWFHRIINARERKLTHPTYANLDELELYAESTHSTLLYLTLSALPLNSLTMDHLASHIGKAAGICAVLRGFPVLAFPQPSNRTHANNPPGLGLPPRRDSPQGIITLPLNVMSSCGVHEQSIFQHGAQATGLKDAIFTVATRASDHLITARSMLSSIKRYEDPGHDYEHASDEGHSYTSYDTGVRLSGDRRHEEYQKGFPLVFGSAVSSQLWLDRLQKHDFDIFNSSLRGTEWKLPFMAWWRFRREEI